MIYGHCPTCGEQATTGGFNCGYSNFTPCSRYRAGSVPYTPAPILTDGQVSLIIAQLRASIELGEGYPAVKNLVELYRKQITDLQEQLEYEKLKTDAYRMVWSAREYLKSLPQTQGTDIAIHQVLSRALNTLDAERVDGVAIREKYNPKVVKLKKAIPPDQFDQNAEYAKHWRPAELVYPAPKYDTPAAKSYYQQNVFSSPDPVKDLDSPHKGPKC